jgi:hypothetical protein
MLPTGLRLDNVEENRRRDAGATKPAVAYRAGSVLIEREENLED